eukprot:GHRQ01005762.1.p1 GENE.GHRQ01005762.1~~GHRQ01005762.1.p1  ORF type:complete len:432 (+),score=179.44 GHRQ01005762.1:599-1894(+)
MKVHGSCSDCETGDQHRATLKRRRVAPLQPGLQVVATLLALRIGYRLAKAAVGKLLAEPKVSPVDEVRHDSFHAEEHAAAADEPAGAAAREQWMACELPAPGVPDGFKLMASQQLPISTYRFYEQFLSVEATCLQDHHRSTGQYDFRSSRWKGPEGSDRHFCRLFDFMQPRKGMCTVNAHCLQQQRFSVHPGGVFVMQTDMHMDNIPYGDCFRVQSLWKAEPDSSGRGCSVSIHVAVPFLKGCLVKGIITKTSLADCRVFFSDFLAKVQNSISSELLPQAAAEAEQLRGALPGLPGAAVSRDDMPSPFAAVDAEVGCSSRHPPAAGSSKRPGMQQQQHQQQHRHGALHSRQQQGAAAALERRLSRVSSAKPSFAQPMAELRLAGRALPAQEVINTVQAILLLLVLVLQLLMLYDSYVLHHRLALPGSAHTR